MFRSASNLGLLESLTGVRGILGPGTAYPSAYSYPYLRYGCVYPYGAYGYPYGGYPYGVYPYGGCTPLPIVY